MADCMIPCSCGKLSGWNFVDLCGGKDLTCRLNVAHCVDVFLHVPKGTMNKTSAS